MKDIEYDNNGFVRMYKKLWHDSEITLAKCFGFIINIDDGTIIANAAVTNKKSLYDFIRISFKSFSESLDRVMDRDNFFAAMETFYSNREIFTDTEMQKALPYYNLLYSHQKDVLTESYFKQYNFLALEMGLGKTLTSASISRMHRIPLTVIVCPAAVKYNWYRDLCKFGFNELYFTILDSTRRRTVRAFQERFVIINYDILSKFGPELIKRDIGHFILDEAHGLKNHLSQRTKNMRQLIEHFPNARISFLSGTPIKNRVNDVFSYLKIIGHELGVSHKKFLDEYTIKSSGRGGDRVTGGRNLQDLYLKLSNFMIRKTKEECLDLPDKVYLSYRFEMDDYRDEYNKIIEELSQQKEMSALSGNLHSLNIITSKAKIKGVIELAEQIISEGRKPVIFGGYNEPLELLEKHFGHRCTKITGSVNSFERDQRVQRFIDDPECEVFLGNMVAAGVGINLVNASDVIFLNFPFTPAELHQAIDRCHRIGQSKSVNIHYTFCDESIDEYIYEIIIDKHKDINAVVDNNTQDIITRGNTIEILIKKLLNKNVDIEIPVSEVHEQAETTEVVGEPNFKQQGQNISDSGTNLQNADGDDYENSQQANGEQVQGPAFSIGSPDASGVSEMDGKQEQIPPVLPVDGGGSSSQELMDKWILEESTKNPGHTQNKIIPPPPAFM